MAYTTIDHPVLLTPEVNSSGGSVRIHFGVMALHMQADEAEALGMKLLQHAKYVRQERALQAGEPAIQSGNTDLHDPANDAEAAAA